MTELNMDEFKNKIRLSGVIKESITDGPGVRYVVFTQGCPHNCPGCHNQHAIPFVGGTIEDCDYLINEMINNPLNKGLTLSGGEPFAQAGAAAYLAKEAKRHQKDVITYTGYIFEDLLERAKENGDIKELLENSDYIVDGPFLQKYRSLELQFRGSKNQRIIDVKKSLLAKNTITKSFDE